MRKKERLHSKIKRLFKRAGHPRWYHHMGPKKFQTWVLCLGLIVKQIYQLSYRRAKRFLDEYFNIQLHWTTLQKAAKRLPKSLWQSLLATTIEAKKVYLSAVDGTGMARSNPSRYYLKRIDREQMTTRPTYCISLVDVKHRKFLASTLLAKPANEIKYAKTLHKQSPVTPEVLLEDKGFDAEHLHQWLEEHGTFSIAPVRKGCENGRHRKLLRDCFDWTLYWQRNIIESLWSALKRLFGSTIHCKHIKTQTAELFCRLIAYNLGYSPEDFLLSPVQGNVYKYLV